MSPTNYFASPYSQEELGGPLSYRSAQFHFHAKSEHTINGKRYDLEMHTVHYANKRRILAESGSDGKPISLIASAVGIMFDVDDYDPTVTGEEKKVIDAFFDSMGFDTAPPSSDKTDTDFASSTIPLKTNSQVPYKQLTDLINFANRWTYVGSLTTPPCTVGIYFQVAERVLPISKKHYDAYVAHQAKYVQKKFYDN